MTGDLIFVFHSTHKVIAGEQALLDAGVGVKVVMVPDSIRSGCGLCLRVPPQELEKAKAVLADKSVETQQVYSWADGRYAALGEGERVLFTQALGIDTGEVVAIVGCGGKTALMHRLARENEGKKVLLSTTTHIRRPLLDGISGEFEANGSVPLPQPQPGICLVYGSECDGKLSGVAPETLKPMVEGFDLTLLECDGSKGLPLKGWADWEPVVPPFATLTVGVCTLWPEETVLCQQNTHRPDLFCALTGAVMGDAVTLDHIAAMISRPGGMMDKAAGRKALLINQVETGRYRELAQELIRRLPEAFRQSLSVVVAASVRNNWCEVLAHGGE